MSVTHVRNVGDRYARVSPTESLVSASYVEVDGKHFCRAGQHVQIRGVTYGPFAPHEIFGQFPDPDRVHLDFDLMRRASINAIRTYHPPTRWLLEAAEEHDILVLVDVPWPKHLCFLDSSAAQKEARTRVLDVARIACRHPNVFATSIGNEIPANVVRWHSARKVERFLAELTDVARQAHPAGLVTYANYPSTEYLDLSFLDFATFNIYLHDLHAFRSYLFRLQNQTGDKPFVLGEIGMDTMGHGSDEQARFLAGHLCEAQLMGVAGSFVFSWTDDWYTGGYQIEEWGFGLTRADRSPKPAYSAVSDVYSRRTSELLQETPRVSVVVCSYNGGRTLDQCLRSLLDLDYPDYEVILVDDGSTDETQAIAARFPTVRNIQQPNRGLSVARNVGLEAATGSIVAYTDSDCYADRNWLAHIVHQLQASGAEAIGGPNLSPDDGWLSACVAASPGQPTHVLENDQVAEHVPGCNMAFRREALEAVHGFQPQYQKAGDDVDLCWRLQQAGMWITFAPGAYVWHHRRQNPRTYLKQQAGYGEAEALLRFDHPDRFNGRGESRWRGIMYGAALPGLRFGRSVIYHGTFGTGLFQTIYMPGTAHWALLLASLEWLTAALAIAVVGRSFPMATFIALSMVLTSITVALVRALQARLPARYDTVRSRLVVAALSFSQPLVRSWSRYRTWWRPPPAPKPAVHAPAFLRPRIPLSGQLLVEFWHEDWIDRTTLLDRLVSLFQGRRWPLKVDSGWADWDVEIHCYSWMSLRLRTAQEDHGSGKRLVRVRCNARPSEQMMVYAGASLVAVVLAGTFNWVYGFALSVALLTIGGIAWVRGLRKASTILEIMIGLARDMEFVVCESRASSRESEKTSAATVEVGTLPDGVE